MTFAPAERWYPIEACRRPGVPVIVVLEDGGTEVLAIIRRHSERQRAWWWFQIGAWGGPGIGWMPRTEIALDMWGRSQRRAKSPALWRPAPGIVWPDALPAPIEHHFTARAMDLTPHPTEADALDPYLAHDGWPAPGLKLGERTPPVSFEECEARILRAFRTEETRAGGVRGHRGSGGFCGDIPSDMVRIALKAAEAQRLAESGERSFEAVRSAWSPTRRDNGDWDYAQAWLRPVSARDRQIVKWRAADPPWSWRQIAEKLRVSKTGVELRYRAAIETACKFAQRDDTCREGRA